MSEYDINMYFNSRDLLTIRWRRGLITKEYDFEDKRVYDVFFVDLGDTQYGFSTSEMLLIPSQLANRLPCQAIGLKLAHIVPLDFSENENIVWSTDVQDKVIQLLVDKDAGVSMEVVVRKIPVLNMILIYYSIQYIL
jgi:hypothetical protein